MLVISRRLDESIRFPNLGITVTLLKNSGSRIRLGIEAPTDVSILRGELCSSDDDPQPPVDVRQAIPVESRVRECFNRACESLQQIRDLIETNQWQSARPSICAILRDLKSMDEQVAAVTRGAKPPARPPKRALLVDDNHNESRLLAGYLRMKAFNVDVAHDGADALKYLDENDHPDIVLLDMNMPKYDGKWTVNQVRSDPKYKDLRIFAVSGSEPDDYDIKLGEGGIERWIRKPLNPEQLVEEIEKEANAADELELTVA